MIDWPETPLTRLLGIDVPLVQAPMASVTTPSLVAAVAEAGGLGSLGAATLNADDLRARIGAIRQATARPFNVNFFAHEAPRQEPDQPGRALRRLAPLLEEFGAVPPADPQPPFAPFAPWQLEILLEDPPPVVSFHFGLPPRDQVAALQERGTRILCSATTVAEARHLEAAGVDAVIAQGQEAGGHQGFFLEGASSTIGTFALLPQVVDAVRCPVIAAGGIMDGRGIVAAMVLGAAGVQMGTAFLRTEEAATADYWRDALASEAARETRLSRAFTGRPARAIVNRFVREMAAHEADPAPFPLQTTLTTALRAAVPAERAADFASMWAGQGAPLARALPAADLVRTLDREVRAVLAGGPPPV